MSQSFTIYQIVHTLDGQIFHLEAHLKLLFEAYYELFSGFLKVDQPHVEALVREAMLRSRCPRDISLFVRIAVDSSGQISVEELERSLYRGYTMRCVTPHAVTVEYHIPHIDQSTFLRDSLTEWANAEARRQGAQVALRSHGGRVDLVNGAQIFGLSEEREVTTAKHSHSVEHALVKDIIRREGFILIEVEDGIPVSALGSFEELFYADHHGITALRSCNRRGYMAVTANKISTLL